MDCSDNLTTLKFGIVSNMVEALRKSGVDAVTARAVGGRHEGAIENVEFLGLVIAKEDWKGDDAQRGNDTWVGRDSWARVCLCNFRRSPSMRGRRCSFRYGQ
ncbi:hypothetical protein RJT34_13919 [Clitoria ternatea]|uniref:Uncharacterized protein n=1 Tax=Clitoria ternatea TaxID=43366 RepID=A0AAN9PKL9_CLITE